MRNAPTKTTARPSLAGMAEDAWPITQLLQVTPVLAHQASLALGVPKTSSSAPVVLGLVITGDASIPWDRTPVFASQDTQAETVIQNMFPVNRLPVCMEADARKWISCVTNAIVLPVSLFYTDYCKFRSNVLYSYKHTIKFW